MDKSVISRVETDAFCDCGYNLHGQGVWRDEALGLLVCRCPECGKHAAAGRFTGIHSAWLHRLSLMLLVGWLGFVVLMVVVFGIAMGSLMSVHLNIFTDYEPVPTVIAGGSTPYELGFQKFDASGPGYITGVGITLGFFSALSAMLAGVMAATFCWHLRGQVYIFMALPVVTAGLVWWIWSWQLMTAGVHRWMIERIAMYAGWDVVWMVIGIAVGRPMARGILSLLLPARLLQHFGFLWYRDGKTLKIREMKKT